MGLHLRKEIYGSGPGAGRTIGQIDIRKKYKINIMGIKKSGKLELSITPDMMLESKSTMLVLGRNREIQKCFRI